MPQLDNTMIVPQMVWMCVSFISFYFLLTYYFLPTTLKTIKTKVAFTVQTQSKNKKISMEILNRHKHTMSKTSNYFEIIKNNMTLKSFLTSKNSRAFPNSLRKMSKTIAKAMKRQSLYNNKNTTEALFVFPGMLNLKK
uniref:ATP synthase F0 subunit 8 n=1 Tax=Bostrychia tenuissima TaxID=196631 RepID=UPI002E79E78C|nr:ATP synthase F0 subunit 8 [Bostrychia tenuissima]WQF69448.1 ATP synthase F0 subunit 8 [Bostrychia tenuissima]